MAEVQQKVSHPICPPQRQIQTEATGHAAPDAVILGKLVDAPDGMSINDVGALLGGAAKLLEAQFSNGLCGFDLFKIQILRR